METILVLGLIAVTAYFSYRAGYHRAVSDMVPYITQLGAAILEIGNIITNAGKTWVEKADQGNCSEEEMWEGFRQEVDEKIQELLKNLSVPE